MIIIGVCGGTASGKSTLSKEIINFFNKREISTEYLMLDNYYKDLRHLSKKQRVLVNFDHPESIDFELFYQHLKLLRIGKTVNTPTYCYKTHLRKHNTIPAGKSDILVIDGLFILFKKNIRNFFDLTIFLDVSVDLRIKRRIKRDIVERGRKKLDILERFEKMINPMHVKFVEPTKDYAKLIFKENTQHDLLYQHLEVFSDEIIKKNKKP